MRYASVAIVLMIISGCASQPATHPTQQNILQRHDIVALSVASTTNPVNQCLDITLRYNLGLLMLQAANISPQQMHKDMLSGAIGADLVQQKEHEFELWSTGSSLGTIDQNHFDYCLSKNGLETSLQTIEAVCFSYEKIPATAQLNKMVDVSENSATDREIKTFGKSDSKADLTAIVEHVYAAANPPDVLSIQRIMFSKCVQSGGYVPLW